MRQSKLLNLLKDAKDNIPVRTIIFLFVYLAVVLFLSAIIQDALKPSPGPHYWGEGMGVIAIWFTIYPAFNFIFVIVFSLSSAASFVNKRQLVLNLKIISLLFLVNPFILNFLHSGAPMAGELLPVLLVFWSASYFIPLLIFYFYKSRQLMPPQNQDQFNIPNQTSPGKTFGKKFLFFVVSLALIIFAVLVYKIMDRKVQQKADSEEPNIQFSATATSISQPTDWKTKYGFEFEYPQTLSVSEGYVSSIEESKGVTGVVNIFTVPHGQDRDGVVLIFDLPLVQVAESVGFDNAALSVAKTVSHNGISWTVIYTVENEAYRQYVTERGGKTFWVSADDRISQPDFEVILNTFKFVSISTSALTKIKDDGRFVSYSGSITVSGKYRELYPGTLLGGKLCFYVDNESAHLIPRDPNLWGPGNGDNRVAWFCFKDQNKAKEMFGIKDDQIFSDETIECIQGKATVQISNYVVDKLESSVVDIADLDKIISKENYSAGCE